MNSNGSIHLDVFIIFLPFGKIKFRKGMNRDTKGTNYALIDLIDTEREIEREREKFSCSRSCESLTCILI